MKFCPYWRNVVMMYGVSAVTTVGNMFNPPPRSQAIVINVTESILFKLDAQTNNPPYFTLISEDHGLWVLGEFPLFPEEIIQIEYGQGRTR